MILTVGTSLVLARAMIFDRVEVDGVNRTANVLVSAAGKSVNVARVVNSLGEATLATGVVGGCAGSELAGELDRAGVKHDFVVGGAATRVCVTLIDRSTGHATELVQEPPAIADQESEAFWAKLLELVPAARAVVMSGVLAPGIPPGFYAMVCRLAGDCGVPVIVDARGDSLLLTLPHSPTLVKPNRAELSETLQRPVATDEDLKTAMALLVEKGARSVAVTMGKDGAVLFDGSTFLRGAAPVVKVVSPIGSGDAFAGAMAVSMVRGTSPAEALRLAIACGAANAMTSQAGFLDATSVSVLAERVRVDHW